MTDKLNHITGILTLQAYNKQNRLLWEKSSHNLIVLSGYHSIAKALAGVPDMQISKVAVGTNGIPAQEDDSLITDAVLIDILKIEYPKITTVRFHFEIGYSDCLRMNIREFGLLTNDGKLFSRKVRETIEKNQQFKILGIWDINICDSAGIITQPKSYSNAYSSAYPAMPPSHEPYVNVSLEDLTIENDETEYLNIESNTKWDIT